jgi:hypothetical protein
VIEARHSTLEFELRSVEHFATRAQARARVAAWLEDYINFPQALGAGHEVPGGLGASAGGKGRRVSAAGPLRGPVSRGGCAAAGLAAR